MNHKRSISQADRLDRAIGSNRVRLAAVIPLVVMAVYMYGMRPLIMTAVAAVTALLCDLLASAMRRREWEYTDVSSILFAVLLVGLVPATLPYHILLISVATAILVGKHLFGGFGSYPFHPTALGYVVAVVSWPEQMLSFPAPFTQLPLGNTIDFTAVEAPATTLKLGGMPILSDIHVLLGSFAGPLGATTTLVVLACGLLLLAVHRFDLAMPLSFAASCIAIVWLFPRVEGVSTLLLLVMEVMVSGLAFGCVFLLQDEVTSPHSLLSRILYGILVGVFTMLYQYYGSHPYGICFGILCGNALSGFLDHLDEYLRRKLTERRLAAKPSAAPQAQTEQEEGVTA